MKIVLIGGGSYVFAPSVIKDVIIDSKLTNFDFVLVDINLEAAQLLAKAAARIAKAEGVNVNVSATNNREEALAGASYVITSIAVQGEKRWLMDYEICKQEGIPQELRETGALSGITYALRNATLIMDVCRDMERLCPSAILLNVSNPLTRLHEAINRYTKIEAYGFCSVAQCGQYGYERIATGLGLHYSDIDVVSAGINHFSWVISIRDKKTGADLFPAYIDSLILKEKTDNESSVTLRWYRKYGALIAPPVDHVGDFLPAQDGVHYLTQPPFHGNAEERARRIDNMKRFADGEVEYGDNMGEHATNIYRQIFVHGASWEHPGLFAVARHRGDNLCLPALNLPNRGYLPQLPADAIVEIPAHLCAGKLEPMSGIMLPSGVVDMCLNQCEVAAIVAKAAVEGDRAAAKTAIEIDQAITHKAAATRALEKILEIHADIMPQFN